MLDLKNIKERSLQKSFKQPCMSFAKLSHPASICWVALSSLVSHRRPSVCPSSATSPFLSTLLDHKTIYVLQLQIRRKTCSRHQQTYIRHAPDTTRLSSNVKYREMSTIMKCKPSSNVINVINVNCHEIANVMKCQPMSSNVNSHQMSNTDWYDDYISWLQAKAPLYLNLFNKASTFNPLGSLSSTEDIFNKNRQIKTTESESETSPNWSSTIKNSNSSILGYKRKALSFSPSVPHVH